MRQEPLRAWLAISLKTSLVALVAVGCVVPMLAIAAPSRTRGSVMFRPRRGEGAPAQSRGGATRGTCIQDVGTSTDAMRLIIFSDDSSSQPYVSALTAAQHPSFLVYVPQTSAAEAEFTLKTDVPDVVVRRGEAEQYTYSQRIKLTGKPGILRISLPTTTPGLTVGTAYQWSFSLICGGDRSNDPVAEGRVRRVSLSPSEQLQLRGTKDPIAQAAIYGQAGIWYDMVAALADAWSKAPHDRGLAQHWVDVLQSETVNIGSLSQASLLN